MSNKVLVKVYTPIIDQNFDVWIPKNKSIYNVIKLLSRAIFELSRGYFAPQQMPMLYDKETSKQYELEKKVKDVGIVNGTELILI